MMSPSSPTPTNHSSISFSLTQSQDLPPSGQTGNVRQSSSGTSSVVRPTSPQQNPASPTVATSPTTTNSANSGVAPPSLTSPNSTWLTTATTSTATATAIGRLKPSSNTLATSSSLKSTVWHGVASSIFLLAAVIVYGATLGIAASATSRHSLLGLVSASVGTWFLTVLSKLGDITFAVAMNQALDLIAWGRLKKLSPTSSGQEPDRLNLLHFLSITSITGPLGLMRLLLASGAVQPNSRTNLRLLSIFRLFFILALIPGPGVIIMANVNQRDLYFAVETIDITGGLGVYDPDIAKVYATESGFDIVHMVQGLLRDAAIVSAVDPISETCRASNSCTSYLISGAYNTVRPLPFMIQSDNAPSFTVFNAPAYQLDFWDPPADLAFQKHECSTYGAPFNGSDAFVLCNAQSGDNNQFAGGLAWCGSGLAPNGTCLDPISKAGNTKWATSWAIWRRESTVTFSRTDYHIQDVRDLGVPSPQPVSSSDLFVAYDLMFYKPTLVSNYTRCDLVSGRYELTQNLAYKLYSLSSSDTNILGQGRDYLRNVLAIPLFLFTPTIRIRGGPTPFLNQTQSGLPDENQITGSYSMKFRRSVPGRWSIIAYGVVGGITLLLAAIGHVITARWPEARTTEFPLLDFAALTKGYDDNGTGFEWAKDMPQGQDYGNGSVLQKIRDLQVGLQDSPIAGSPANP